MAAYCFFDIQEITDPDGMDRYRARVLPTVQRYGGTYRVVGGTTDVVEGNWSPVLPVLIEFPSLDRAREWYNSDEYRDLKTLRLSATRGTAVFMESEPSEFVPADDRSSEVAAGQEV